MKIDVELHDVDKKVVVLKGDWEQMDDALFDTLTDDISKLYSFGAHMVLVLANEIEISTLDEKAMSEYGWRRISHLQKRPLANG
jgi:hypothetical protein